MNVVDLLLVVYVGAYALFRFRRGFVRLSLELGGLLASIGIALLSYPMVATWLRSVAPVPGTFSKAIGFVLILMIAETLIFWGIRLLIRAIPHPLLESPLNRWAGLVPAAASGVVISAVLATIAYGLPLPADVKGQINTSKLVHPLINETQALSQPVFGDALTDLLGTLTRQQEGERTELGFTATNVKVDERAERRMLELLNRERTSRGLQPLTLDTGKLRDVARAHSRDMFARGYFAHENPEGKTPFDRMQEGGVTFLAAGENLAFAPDVEIAHKGLINSPPHRKNILDPDFRRVGIGAISAGFRGEMFTQNFTN